MNDIMRYGKQRYCPIVQYCCQSFKSSVSSDAVLSTALYFILLFFPLVMIISVVRVTIVTLIQLFQSCFRYGPDFGYLEAEHRDTRPLL